MRYQILKRVGQRMVVFWTLCHGCRKDFLRDSINSKGTRLGDRTQDPCDWCDAA